MKPTTSQNTEKSPIFKGLNPSDAVLLAFLLLGFLLLSAAIYIPGRISGHSSGNFVSIRQNGETIHTLPLNKNQTITITKGTFTNTITIQDGTAYVSHSNCKNQVCVHSRGISTPGQSIVCLPHRLTLTIQGETNQNNLPDSVSR